MNGRRGWLRVLTCAALWCLIAAASPLHSYAQSPQPAVVIDAGFDQRLDNMLPLDLEFQNDQGRTVRLGDYIKDRPVLLSFNYFHCIDLCPVMLEELAKSLNQLDFNLNEQFAVITVSIDPSETTREAADKKQALVSLYGRDGASEGWHFLLGAPTVLGVLAQAAGLRYQYDAGTKQFVHPLGLLVLTPQGRIARYLYGLDIPARDIRLALIEASEGKIGSPLDQVALLCYHYEPLSGTYSAMAFDLARWVGVASVAGLALFLGSLWRHEAASRVRTEAAAESALKER